MTSKTRNNRNTMLTEKNQSILSWVVSQPMAGSSKKPVLIVEASLKIRYFDFNEEAIVLICDSTGRSEFWDKFHLL